MMTSFAAALLAASLAADPAPAADPARPEAAPHHHAMKAVASPEALKDARAALLGPCAPEQAKGKVTAVELLDGTQLNERLEKEKSQRARAEPAQHFLMVSYAAGATRGKSIRQVTTHLMLTQEQAQVLVGEKVCVYKE
jgi:hypothetical protein